MAMSFSRRKGARKNRAERIFVPSKGSTEEQTNPPTHRADHVAPHFPDRHNMLDCSSLHDLLEDRVYPV